MDATIQHVVLQQVHRIRGQNLLKRNPDLANKPVPLRRLGKQCRYHQKRRKQHQHPGIGNRLGRIDHVMRQRLTHSRSKF